MALLLAAFASALSTASADESKSPNLNWDFQLGSLEVQDPEKLDVSGWMQLDAEIADYNANQILWLRTQLTLEKFSEYKVPAISLPPWGNAEAVFINDKKIGETGRFFRLAREFAGTSANLVPRIYLLTDIEEGDAHYLYVQRQILEGQAIADLNGTIIGEYNELLAQSHSGVLQIWLRDWSVLIILLVGTLFSLAIVRGSSKRDRNRWLPWFLASAIPITFFESLPAYQLGYATPEGFWISEFVPYIALGLIHVASVYAVRIDVWMKALLASYYSGLAGIFALNLPASQFITAYSLIILFVAAAAGLLIFRALRQPGRKVQASPWHVIALVCALIMIILYTVAGSVIPEPLNPLYIGSIFVVISLLLAMADDYRKDKQALAQATGQLLIAQDLERERLAKKLHDDLSHRIAAVRLRLETLFYGEKESHRDQLIDPIEDLVSIGMDVSGTVENLRPATLSPLTFTDMINHSVERWMPISDAQISVETGNDATLPETLQTEVFRIFQEALYNAVRHSNADAIQIKADVTGKNGYFEISDDGEGFDVLQSGTGLGLSTMHERAELVGAAMIIDSDIGKGTSVRLEFKLP